ncbi:hypothetical protein, partial [Pengzhenrongella sp.]|uniref:hypothetical protein n=1 Tax=Pengzhenrongella sp. TaxID=2888820 RepID=UPI002F93E4CD
MPSRKKRSGKMRAPSPIALVDRVGSAQEAGELAAHLLDRTRTRPVVVISIASGRLEPFIEPEPVAHALGDFAEVVVVPTNEVSWALSRALPDMTQVYGGAGRVYPIGLDWTGDYRLSPLRFAYTAQEGAGAGDLLVEDAIGMAARAGVRQETKTSSRRVSGTVSALFPPTRAFVTLLDGSLATVWQELTTSHAPIDRVLVRGQFVEGMLDDATGRLDISELLRPAAESLDEYQPGAVVLVQVATVTVDAVTVLLHPDVSATIQREQVTTNELDGLDALFSAGEILPARIDARSRLSFELRLDDLDDVDEPLAAPSLMPDGPPWLELPAEEVTVAPGPAEPVRPSPVLPVSALPSSQRPPLSQPPSAAAQ